MLQKSAFTATPTAWSHWLSGLSATVLWGAAAASAVAWGLAFWPGDGKPLAPNITMDATPSGSLPAGEIGKVLGATLAGASSPAVAAPEISSRLALVGIAKSGAKQSLALIAVDGQAAKPFARGAEVLPGLLLQSVTLQQAQLGASMDGPAVLQLNMPVRPEPATGVLPN